MNQSQISNFKFKMRFRKGKYLHEYRMSTGIILNLRFEI